MEFSFLHNCVTVTDIDRSIKFYSEALDLILKRRIDNPNMILAYMGDAAGSKHELELTWRRRAGKEGKYQLGDNAFHFAFEVDDYAGALARHKAMGCVKTIIEQAGVYFIADPDGYLIEILPNNHFTKTAGML